MALTLSTDVARASLAVTAEQISVVSRNIARVGDANASRKYAQVVSGPGSSVHISGIQRSYDKLLLETYLSSNSSNEAQTTITSALTQLQNTVDDANLERSPAALIAKLSSALQTYSASPQNSAVAASVVSAAKDVANALNAASTTVASVRQQADTDIATSVGNINDLLAQFHAVNTEIVKGTATGSDVSDALDNRDAILKKLSTEVGVRTSTRENGDMTVYTDSGVTLYDRTPRTVTFQKSGDLSASAPGQGIYADGVPIAGTSSNLMEISTGKLAGLVTVRDQISTTYQSQLDEMARGLISAFAETDQSATPTLPAAAGLFTYTGGPSIPAAGTVYNGIAGSIKVNPNVDPSSGGNADLIRDGGISNPSNPAYKYNTTGGASYTDRIQALITNIGATQTFDPSTQISASASLSDYSKSSVSWLEALRQSASSEADYRQAVADRASAALSSKTGVSLDEEMTNMLSLERTFQASSRLINTVDSMLSTLLQAFG